MRRYENYELELTLKDTKPSFRRQYKLSQDDALECHRQIIQMAVCDIIEPKQNSKYQIAIFTVNISTSGQKRAVLDLRHINQLVEPFLLQLPDMNQLLHSLAAQKGQYHTCFDLAPGFSQIPLKDGNSRDVTSFCDPVTGLRYRYKVAPFGLAPSPAAMITVLMGLMSPLVAQNIAFVYIDDICIASSDWSIHLDRLETVLKTLDLNNLSCQPTKTSVAFPSNKFLGFEVSKDGLKITDDKIKIIKALKPPHAKK
jgi:Reverse transcriptase (RNA-dependent DNA polymerase)